MTKTLRAVVAGAMLAFSPTVMADTATIGADEAWTNVAQARPQRPRPVQRPVQPTRRPVSRPATRDSTVYRIDRSALDQQLEIEEKATRLVSRTRASLEKGKSAKRQIERLERDYALTFVRIANRHTLVRHREIVGVDLKVNDLQAVRDLGFKIYRSSELSALGLRLDLLQVPENLPMQQVMDALAAAGATGNFSYNAIFAPANDDDAAQPAETPAAPNSLEAASLGMIDTGVHTGHSLLADRRLEQQNFGRGQQVTPRNHGTAVASILTSKGLSGFYVADVFSGPILFADAEGIVLALQWLATKNVGVINMSLAGPPSPLLEVAVTKLTEAGHVIVAAVGNNGAGGEALFPASYSDVVGVTAVDDEWRVFKDAHQGRAVDYAAPGVKLRAAALTGRKRYSGTSFAAPAVSAFLVVRYQHPDKSRLSQAFDALDKKVQDAGAPGRDPVFGVGILKP